MGTDIDLVLLALKANFDSATDPNGQFNDQNIRTILFSGLPERPSSDTPKERAERAFRMFLYSFAALTFEH